MEKVLFKLNKSADRQLRITLQEYRGAPLLDVRYYYLDSGTGEYRPTKQGIALASQGMIDDLAKALLQASKEYRKIGST
jgi:hypothetical protein